jgi:hypothetical protein
MDGYTRIPNGYQHGYTLGYRWVFMGIDGYFANFNDPVLSRCVRFGKCTQHSARQGSFVNLFHKLHHRQRGYQVSHAAHAPTTPSI